jgi:hypothetical protein
MMLRMVIGAVAVLAFASAAGAGDQGEGLGHQ